MLRILVFLAMAAIAASTANATSQDIILIIDNSGSMKKNDPQFLTRKTVAEFVSGLAEQQRAGLLLFGTQSRLISDLHSSSQLNSRIKAGELAKIDYRDMWTDTAAAIELALYELKMNGATGAEAVIIILTDGIVDTGDKQDSERRREWIMGGLAQQAHQANVRVFSIAFTAAADYELLQTLSQTTQGDYFRILSATDIPAVFNKIDQLLLTPSDNSSFTTDDHDTMDALDALDAFAFDLSSTAPTTSHTNPVSGIAEPSESNISALTVTDNPITTADALIDSTKQSQDIPEFSGRNTIDETPSEQSPSSPTDEPEQATPRQQPRPVTTDGLTSSWLIWSVVGLAFFILMAALIWTWLKRPKINSSAPEAVLHDLGKVTGSPRIDVTGSVTRMGRDPGRASWLERPRIVVFENPGISRLHATLEYRPDGYWLIDQNSKNGCMVNYERTRLPRKLLSGDKIQIAKVEFIFELPIAEETDETILFGK